MSGEYESTDSDERPQVLTAEFKDGQLQIVEVIPFDKERVDTQVLTDMNCDSSNNQTRYMQVLDSNKGLVQLDLLNLTLVRCQDGEESYQLVANAEASDSGDINSDSTVTCVLQSSDTEDQDNRDSYVVVETDNEQGPLVFLKSTLEQMNSQKSEDVKKKLPTTAEFLEKAKALQKVKALTSSSTSARRHGRKRKSDLPPPHELLASPNFKLYLYSCRLCSFKCNAVKEMSAHKADEHGAGASGRARGAGRGGGAALQCARCPFRASVHSQLMKHIQEKHVKKTSEEEQDAEVADVLVCGACGYESSSRQDFRRHIMVEHGAAAC